MYPEKRVFPKLLPIYLCQKRSKIFNYDIFPAAVYT